MELFWVYESSVEECRNNDMKLKSVIDHLDSCRSFPRLCIGVGNPPGTMDMKAFLLQKFSSQERGQIDAALEQGVHAVRTLVLKGFDTQIERFNLSQKYKYHKLGRQQFDGAVKMAHLVLWHGWLGLLLQRETSTNYFLKATQLEQNRGIKARHRSEEARDSSFSPMAGIPPPRSYEHLAQQLQHLESLLATLDPTRNLGARFGLRNPVEFLPMHRGRMYAAYSQLRESKLRRKKSEAADGVRLTPKKKVTFLGGSPVVRRNELAVGRSVPDLSAVLRKENKKPIAETTPPMAAGSKAATRGGWSKSASGVEKRGGGQGIVRKSCVNLKELKGMSAAAAFAIDEEGRGGRNRVVKKGVLGQRQ
ncbi:hypothetical protein ACLOJK_001289 [Asimina triloba]